MLYVPSELSFISKRFFVLNLGGSLGVLSNKFIIFGIPLLYCYFSLRSSIIFYLSSGDTYFPLGISLSCFFVTVSELFCIEFLEIFVILSATLLPFKSPVAFAVFWTALFEAVLRALVVDCLAWSKVFWLYLLFKFLLIFYQYFTHILSKRQKFIVFNKYFKDHSHYVF